MVLQYATMNVKIGLTHYLGNAPIGKRRNNLGNLKTQILVQVKGGGVKSDNIATLLGDMNNQKAAGGVLITLEEPNKPMVKEAIDAGRYTAKLYQKEYPKIQILTVEDLLAGTERLEAPPQANPFAKAEWEVKAETQEEML